MSCLQKHLSILSKRQLKYNSHTNASVVKEIKSPASKKVRISQVNVIICVLLGLVVVTTIGLVLTSNFFSDLKFGISKLNDKPDTREISRVENIHKLTDRFLDYLGNVSKAQENKVSTQFQNRVYESLVKYVNYGYPDSNYIERVKKKITKYKNLNYKDIFDNMEGGEISIPKESVDSQWNSLKNEVYNLFDEYLLDDEIEWLLDTVVDIRSLFTNLYSLNKGHLQFLMQIDLLQSKSAKLVELALVYWEINTYLEFVEFHQRKFHNVLIFLLNGEENIDQIKSLFPSWPSDVKRYDNTKTPIENYICARELIKTQIKAQLNVVHPRVMSFRVVHQKYPPELFELSFTSLPKK